MEFHLPSIKTRQEHLSIFYLSEYFSADNCDHFKKKHKFKYFNM